MLLINITTEASTSLFLSLSHTLVLPLSVSLERLQIVNCAPFAINRAAHNSAQSEIAFALIDLRA